MILQNAILSELPFKRESETDNHWRIIDKSGYISFCIVDGNAPLHLRMIDILAMDWEIKQ